MPLFLIISVMPLLMMGHAYGHFTVTKGGANLDVRKLSQWVDSSGMAGIEEVIGAGDDLFQPYSPDIGYSESLHWYKFSVENPWPQDIGQVLRLTGTVYKDVQLFRVINGGKPESLDNQRFRSNLPAFHVIHPSSEAATYYLKVHYRFNPKLKLFYSTPVDAASEILLTSIVRILCLGVFGALGLFNLYCFFSQKIRYYLFYSLFVGFGCSALLMAMGDFYVLTGVKVPHHPSVTLGIIAVGFLGFFGRSFFKTAKFSPRLDQAIRIYGLGGIIASPFLILLYEGSIRYVYDLYLLLGVVLVGVNSLLAYRNGNRLAMVYLVSLGIGFLNVMILLAPVYGMMEGNFYSYSAVHFTLAIEGILVTCSLSYHLKYLGDELTQSLENANSKLAMEVEKKKQELRAEQVHLIEKAKLSGLADMAASLSYQIKNPLAVIMGYCSRLEILDQRGKLDSAKLLVLTHRIISSAKDIESTIAELYYISREGANEPLQFERVSALIDRVLNICSVRFQETGVQLIKEPIPQSLTLDCQGVLVVQVLLNLLDNAHRAVLDDIRPWVKISCSESDGMVEIVVEDSGVIKDQQTKDQMFRPFFTTKGRELGLGIGLTTAKSIVEKHHGSIFLDSASENTRMVLRLPSEHVLRRNLPA